MHNKQHTGTFFSSGRDGTGFAGPNAASPGRGEAATRSEPATGVR